MAVAVDEVLLMEATLPVEVMLVKTCIAYLRLCLSARERELHVNVQESLSQLLVLLLSGSLYGLL